MDSTLLNLRGGIICNGVFFRVSSMIIVIAIVVIIIIIVLFDCLIHPKALALIPAAPVIGIEVPVDCR